MRALPVLASLALTGVASAQTFTATSLGSQTGAPASRVEPLTLIAGTQTPAPGGTGTFSLFADARAIQGNRVAFIGFDGASDAGIYTFRNGELRVLVDESTTVPGTGATFSTFFDVSIDGNVVSFTGGWPGPGGGCSFSGNEGLFQIAFGGGPVTAIATSQSTANRCFHGVDSNLGLTAVNGGVTSVDVFHNHSETIFTTTGGGLSVLAGPSTSSPSGGTFAGFDQDVFLAGSGYAFAEILTNTIGAVAGVYADYADGQGLRIVADGATSIPGSAGTFQNFASFDFDGTSVAFVGRNASNATAVYTGTSASDLQVAVNNSTPVPGGPGNFFGVSNPIAYDGGAIAFSGFYAGGGYGLFVKAGATVEPIVRKGDVLNGSVAEQAFCRPGHMDGNRLLIEVRFQSSPPLSQRALYLANR